jgi:hypothetical protein
MSPTESRPINRIPQYVLLLAGAALIIFLVLLGTDAISLDGGLTLIIASALFGVGMIAAVAEIGINQTGIKTSGQANEADDQ